MNQNIQQIELCALETAEKYAGLTPCEVIKKAAEGQINLYLKISSVYQGWAVEIFEDEIVNSAPFNLQYVSLSKKDCRSILHEEGCTQSRFEAGLLKDDDGNLNESSPIFDILPSKFARKNSSPREIALRASGLKNSQYQYVICKSKQRELNPERIIDIPILMADLRITKDDLSRLASYPIENQSGLNGIDTIELHEKSSDMLRLMKIAILSLWKRCNHENINKHPSNEDMYAFLAGKSESSKLAIKGAGLTPISPDYLVKAAVKICNPDFADPHKHPDERKRYISIFSKKYQDLVDVSEKYWKNCDFKNPKTIPCERRIMDEFKKIGYDERDQKMAAGLIRPKEAPRSQDEYESETIA